jgi:hypothetical protein
MQQQFDVSLPPSFATPETAEQLTTALKSLFGTPETTLASLISALQYENKPKFGPSAINNLRFNVVRYDAGSLKGRLRLLYDMQLTFGCEDVIKDHLNQHSYYNFWFTPGQGLLHFESDAQDLPSTANEF